MIDYSDCYTCIPNITPLLKNNMLIDNLIPWGTLNFHSGIAFSDKGLYVAIDFKTSTKHLNFLDNSMFCFGISKKYVGYCYASPRTSYG